MLKLVMVGCYALVWGGLYVLFVYSLFVMSNFNYFLDKCGVLNNIIEPAIFIFKINTNIISMHIDIEYRNTYFVPICIV